ncbi:DUF4920 domain-containing protein [Tenacibaculum retecalamus]|uniref:DUF4920 domain-containing protein n=1 Tax=Tenacibaculum retecalamus TaxID=3018315 RepID=UPI0023D96032|nr:DUF4920 domain-containing protein [Tenacibaculum retecalamus]WBX71735.1 DUF4920 domain-containing protein [Tenacibaculum retecalamus]
MKRILIYGLFLSFLMVACKVEKKEETKENVTPKIEFTSFGEKIESTNALSETQMSDKFDGLKIGDTINVKFASKIGEVCTKKGCWMVLPAADKKTMVKFKDYGFFMPLDSQGKEVIIEGKAFVKVTPIDELRHYAEDAGKTKEEIEKITEPKKEFSFLAHGVLMK